MAAATVGGAFLSAFINVVFQRLASPEVVNLIRRKKLDPSCFKDVLYEADDLLDEVSAKAVTQKQVSNMLSFLFNVQDREIVRRLEDIVGRLESILKFKEGLDLKEITIENLSYRTQSTSLQDSSRIYGRDKDKEAIIKLLLDDSSDAEEVSVIPIVGMGGVGKTTLAQLVYNDDNLTHIFYFKAWACVSDEFDILRVTKTITQAITRRACEVNDLNLLHEDLHDKLKDKIFLIVLDDVWMEDYDNWNLLIKPFQRGIKGSKILVTTRNDRVASIVQTVQTYHLNQLSNEDCWLVFANHACLSSISNENTIALEKVDREIVKKCKGLPLAAQSLGGILRRKDNIRDWNNILNSDIWELSENESKIIPALRISYHYLPPHLKRCFVYCSLYPKDYEFKKNDIILLWMAEDLLPPSKKGKALEEVGNECFDYLVSRSLFQRSNTRQYKECFVMHDLIHDLATFLGREFYFTSEELGKETMTIISSKTRHLSFRKLNGPILESFEAFESIKFLRTFMRVNASLNNEKKFLRTLLRKFWRINVEFSPSHNNEKVLCIMKLKYLRVLSFSGFNNLSVLPDTMGELIHLRYLDLSYTSIMALPEPLCKLYNLQTLKLFGCHRLTILASGLQNLVHLHYLGIDDDTPLVEMPKGMSKLNQLNYLPYFIVGKHEENGIMELGGLSNLHESLSIRRLENVTNGSEALEARIMDKMYIKDLVLDWSFSDDCIDSQIEMDILGKLQPHWDLQSLGIDGYRGTRFPDWVGNSSYSNMTKLRLSSCKNCCMVPSLGQLPSLKYLSISNLDGFETIDVSFYGNNDCFLSTPFPVLESLVFESMPCWEMWSSFEPHAIPRLQHLEINNCPRLRGELPSYLPTLQELRISRCERLASSLPRAPAIFKLEIFESNNVVLQDFLKQQKHEFLESLEISSSCDSLTSLLLETFPNLKRLQICNCENLESLSVSQLEDETLQNLDSLEIRECPNLVSMEREGLAAPSKRGMLPSLKSIGITNCEKLLSFLALMDMLTSVEILGPCDGIKSFPKEGLLPASLTSLTVYYFSSLETLDCKGLLHLTSLQQLKIGFCPKLENIAGERLPVSLTRLDIMRCPLLIERFRMKHPQIWPKISHIRSIVIDWSQIPCARIINR
ncbi:P-loop containing nucleoside triphosphate hydrolase [Sesbania bispinosa]|nr:P-loop containing nucleoside triphosphate hydrolase [Sesbania bispinosa]